MKNLNPLSLQPLAKIPKWIVFGMLLVAVLGFIDASYLTLQYYAGAKVPCSLVKGCEQVLTSRYASFGPIPLAFVGALYYLFAIIALGAYLDSQKAFFFRAVSYAVTFGFLISLGLLYLQLFVIHAICMYCLFSLLCSTLLFIGVMYSRYVTYKTGVL